MKQQYFIFAAILAVFTFSDHLLAEQVNKKASSFKWKATQKVGDGHWGSLVLKSATVSRKNGKLQKAVFVIDMTKISVDNLTGKWKKKFLTHMSSEDFFETSKYPTATLILDKQVSDNAVSGKLTIRGKTQPVKISYDKSGQTYAGKLVFDRTQFGVKYGSGKFFKGLGDKLLHDDVTVTFKVVLN